MTKSKVIPSGWWVNQASSSNRGHATVKPQAISSSCMANYCYSLTSSAPFAGQCEGRNQIMDGYCVIPANVTACTGDAGQVEPCNTGG